MLTRKASAPARYSFSSISGVRLVGPTVARILTLRPRSANGVSFLATGNLPFEAPLWQSLVKFQGTFAMDTNADPLDNLPDNVAAAAFRKLVRHLRHRHDAQNIDLMGLSGFCRNCLADWINEAGAGLDKASARELIHGMPAEEWKEKYQTEATPEQIARMEE